MTLMSSSSNSDDIVGMLHPIRTREEFRLCSRRLSQEFGIIDDASSVDVYYKENSVGVPFLWESRPGTPKIKTVVYPLPPLTPPPSFHASPISTTPAHASMRKQSRNQILPKINLRRTHHFEHSPSRSTSSSSGWSSRVSSPSRMSFESRFGGRRIQEEDHHECESPVISTLCFGSAPREPRPPRSPGCSSTIIRLLFRDFS